MTELKETSLPLPKNPHIKGLLCFVLAILGGFAYICQIIPQRRARKVRKQRKKSSTLQGWIARGQRVLMSERVPCFSCHTQDRSSGARAPHFAKMGQRAEKRRPGYSAAEYLVEALYDPNAFIVKGYTSGQMNPVHMPPMSLPHDDILALIVYLRSLGGEVDRQFMRKALRAQTPWRKGRRKPTQGKRKFEVPIFPGDAARGRLVYKKMRCHTCHIINGKGEKGGPDLSSLGAAQSPRYLLESLIAPNAVIVKGYKPEMPENYAELVTPQEMYDMVAYMASLKGKKR